MRTATALLQLPCAVRASRTRHVSLCFFMQRWPQITDLADGPIVNHPHVDDIAVCSSICCCVAVQHWVLSHAGHAIVSETAAKPLQCLLAFSLTVHLRCTCISKTPEYPNAPVSWKKAQVGLTAKWWACLCGELALSRAQPVGL